MLHRTPTTSLPLFGCSRCLTWGISLIFAQQSSRFPNADDAIPAAFLQQLEDAVAERNIDLQGRIALVERIDQLLHSATPEARSRLVDVQQEVRYLEALTNMRLNKLELCVEQIAQLLSALDAKQFHELDFRCRSLQAAVMLMQGKTQDSLVAFEQLLTGDLSGVPEFQLDRARINQAVALGQFGR